MEPRHIRRDTTGCLLAALLGMAFAEGCGPSAEESSRRNTNAKTAQVTSLPPQEGQAFHVAALVSASAQSIWLQSAIRQTGKSNHLNLEVETGGAGAASPEAWLEHRQSHGTDGLLICSDKALDARTISRLADERQMPLLVLEWDNEVPTVLPASFAPMVSAAGSSALQNVSHAALSVAGRRMATLTLYHNGKTVNQTLVGTPQELAKMATETLSAYLRGEKVKPTHKL